MAEVKTNEREGTRSVLRYSRTSAFKVRPVLDLIRGKEVQRAREVLQYSDRDAAALVGKVLASAIANAENNDGLDPEELYVSACYADEATTMKRWRPRARGRATRIRKRSCHVTVIVSRLPEERLARRMRARQTEAASSRRRRVAATRDGRRARRREAPDVPAEDVTAEDVAAEDVTAEDVAAEDVAAEDVTAEDVPAEGTTEEGAREIEGGEPAPSTDEGDGDS